MDAVNAATVARVIDGDTITIREGNKSFTIRLGCIDAPEKAQRPWGDRASSRLKQLLPVGKTVNIRVTIMKKDRYYGSIVNEVFSGKKSINFQMVKEGQAVVNPQYLSNCLGQYQQWLAAQATAKKKKLGFWKQPNPTLPWDFRAGRASGSSFVSGHLDAPKTCDAAYPDVCIPSLPPKVNCVSVPYYNFRVLPPDPHGFDRDGDGWGCE